MTFNLRFTFETDNDSQKYIDEITMLTDELCNLVNLDDYGAGISVIAIHLRFLKAVKGFEDYLKLRKPRYQKSLKYINPLQGEVIINGYFSYEILFSGENYRNIFLDKKNWY